MALQAMWIRKNMLHSPSSDQNHHQERQMSENEMRVLRSIQKLSIPDWYLNNNSRPPKILSNVTPIDLRPPSWKKLPVKNNVVDRTPVPMNNSTVTRDGIMETEIGPLTTGNQSFATYKMNRSLPVKTSAPSGGQYSPPKRQNIKIMNISRTFPRVSPSRKIKNINIVFPQPTENAKCLMVTDLDEPEMPILEMTKDSLDVTNSMEMNDRCCDTSSSYDDSPVGNLTEKKILHMPNPQLIYIKPWKSSPTPHTTVPSDESFKLRASSTPHRSPVAIVSASDFDGTRGKENRRLSLISSFPNSTLDSDTTSGKGDGKRTSSPCFPMDNANFDATSRERNTKLSSKSSSRIYTSVIDATSVKDGKKFSPISSLPIVDHETTSPIKKKRSPPISPRTKKSNVTSKEEKCNCKAVSLKSRRTSLSSPRASVGFRPKNLLPPIPEKTVDSLPPSCSSIMDAKNSSCGRLVNSTGKSSESERIVENKEKPRVGKTLVREIIEELNKKCVISSQSTYISPGSKNFVKKLVRALENGVVSSCRRENEREENLTNRVDNDDAEDYAEEDVFIDSENGSEYDSKSAAVSTSISYKDTDSSSNSSDTDIGSPTIRHHYDKYEWNTNANENGNETMTINNNNNIMKNRNHSITPKISPIVEKEDDDTVYWIPVAKQTFPRTSSLLSIISRVSSNNTGRTSPCVSPICLPNDTRQVFSRPGSSSINIFNATYGAIDAARAKGLRRVNETTILDSGYSDRSSYNGNMTWFDSTETTLTASEIGSCYSDLSQTSAQIHGRPFVI